MYVATKSILLGGTAKENTSLSRMLKKSFPEMPAAETYADIADAEKMINSDVPNIVFLFTDGCSKNCFEKLYQIKKTKNNVEFIIITENENNEYLKAIRADAAGVLKLIIEVRHLESAMNIALARITQNQQAEQNNHFSSNLFSNSIERQRLMIYIKDNMFESFSISDIVKYESEDKYTRFYFSIDGKAVKILSGKSHLYYDAKLALCMFVKTNQSVYINPIHVKGFCNTNPKHLIMTHDIEASIGKTYVNYVKKKLGMI